MRPKGPTTRRRPSIPSVFVPPPSPFCKQDEHEAPHMRPAVIPAADGVPRVAHGGHESPPYGTLAIAPPTLPLDNQGERKRVAHSSCDDTLLDGGRSRLARLSGDRSAVVVR